uniref:Uncharacterized protein n=1 Tax=Glossina austeni TaxID=7395 RepID=A0A1A9VTC8_GLOAU
MNENLCIQVKQMALKGSECTGPGDNGSRDDSAGEKATSVCQVSRFWFRFDSNNWQLNPFHQVNDKCTATLECTIANQDAEINGLLNHEEILRHQVEKMEQSIEELQGHLKALKKHNNALESAMKQSKIAFECEENAVQKVLETVAAVALKYDNMASTIGNGMDEAADQDKKDVLI